MVEFFAVLGRPFQKFWCAIDRDAFLVTGNQKRDRAFWLAAMMVEMVEDGRNRAGDAALHVDRSAAVQLAVRHLAGKWRMLPRFLVAWRDHVGVARKHKIRLRGTNAGVQVLDVLCAGLAKRHAMHRETRGFQHAREKRECATFRRRDRGAAQQIAGNYNGIGGHMLTARPREGGDPEPMGSAFISLDSRLRGNERSGDRPARDIV